MISLRMPAFVADSADSLLPLYRQQRGKRLQSEHAPSSPFAGFSLGTALGGIVSVGWVNG